MQIEAFESPIAKYDVFLQNLFENLVNSQYDKYPTISKFMTSLKCALTAEDVFLVGYFGTSWDVQTARNDDALERARKMLQKNNQILDGLDKAYRYFREIKVADEKIHTNVMFARLQPDNQICIFITLSNIELKNVLVVHNISSTIELDFGFSVIINAILKITDNLSSLVSTVDIETEIHDALKSYFGYVSDYIYDRQFKIFNERLQCMTVFFEPIIQLSREPFIARWEALARDPDKDPKRAPIDLFKIAELWGRKFQLELDMHFLDIAVRKYGAISKSENGTLRTHVARRGELVPLHVNVYPVSLLRRAYRDIIKVIEQETKFPTSKLVLEISEKLPLPKPDNINPAVDEMRWFREQLSYYTDRGISFAIDDFGVGFASTSRLSRMEPEFVKIDRDALLHHFGGFTLEYVQKLVRESFGKMKMIVEGFDDESKLSLAQLHELKVRYVQGHFFGIAQDSVYRLSQEDEHRIVQSLGL